ncbi:type B 50S ribosomal protein L31 [Xenorhabdus szentirmaii]|uniref:Large ribosomal subunit protein bL31B n=1 Tax=Xenorhabdus szentirmaii TaxID=290112 RepID=A0AAW3YW32_9GAMM|nr:MULTISPECIES: type B 50S ribosomal protein L31 [unclassified Xenorhabdus]MBD2791391.1 type B 50S ribosomal protein L31 [Xenorhabdus sp. CUL]MBD2800972.1 type B 50S ribosomal protein L31 [Xenorhabdus sp. M]MBD2803168.1 type B 50S ribosomal protein L31 [Xenorhabdus sp. ZM]
MNQGIHPNYRVAVFHDASVDAYFKVGSTINTPKTITLEGKEYPYVTIEVSAESHPFYSGKQRSVSQEGSTERFQKRFGCFLAVNK